MAALRDTARETTPSFEVTPVFLRSATRRTREKETKESSPDNEKKIIVAGGRSYFGANGGIAGGRDETIDTHT